MLSTRQEQLLTDIIESYIATTEPVGSKLLASQNRWQVSSATLRNEMAVLEKVGMLSQPHTSAGRTPTAEAYRYYVDKYLKPGSIAKSTEKELARIIAQEADDHRLKQMAKVVAEVSGAAVIVALGKNYTYYTGLSNLLAQREFYANSEIHEIVNALDNSEATTNEFLSSLPDSPQVLIGDENPFLQFCSFIITPFITAIKFKGFMGILGPMRMDYNKNTGLINHCYTLLQK